MTELKTLLQKHCGRLEAIENVLYEAATNRPRDFTPDQILKTYELWLRAQNSLRITATALLRS
jgi:hypothetical protein